MSLNEKDVEAIATQFFEAERTRSRVPVLPGRYPGIDLEDAYRAQDLLVARKEAAGFTISGMKVGSTNPKVQAHFGIKEPVCGRLFRQTRWDSGATVATKSWMAPKLECEIAFRIARPLAGPGVTPESALAAAGAVMGAFEIIDPRSAAKDFGPIDLVADNTVNAGCVIGPEYPVTQDIGLANVTVAFARNGGTPARGTGANVLGSPLNVLAWLANWLGARGRALSPGSIVLTGSLVDIFPIEPGDRFEATYSTLGRVAVAFN